MDFSVKWASVGAIHLGMVCGVARMTIETGKLSVAELGVGMFFGGAMALPLAATHLLAAVAVRRLRPAHGFAARAGAFVLVSLGAYLLLIHAMDRALRTMGGLLHGDHALAQHLLFFAGGTFAALACVLVANRLARGVPA